jgi:hypothetical protein
MSQTVRDLIVLVADTRMRTMIEAILGRYHALGFRRLTDDVYAHPHQDTGCLLEAHDFLRSFTGSASYALVLFDRQGCGREDLPRESLEGRVEDELRRNGWGERQACVVIDPELEAWLWSDSPHVDTALGWQARQPSLREWLCSENLWPSGADKPADPRSAYERAVRESRTPQSSSHYQMIAVRASVDRCKDPAFLKLRSTLSAWFAVS